MNLRVALLISLAPLVSCVSRSPSSVGATGESIEGQCQMVVPGRGTEEPCEDITLFLRDTRSRQERRAEISGFDFKFTDLTEPSYILSATSPRYDVETNVKSELSPGQTIKIRVRANPRP